MRKKKDKEPNKLLAALKTLFKATPNDSVGQPEPYTTQPQQPYSGESGLPGLDDILYGNYSGEDDEVFGASSESAKMIYRLPEDRLAKYRILDSMAKDPIIDSALKLHIAHSLSVKSGTNEIISIESTSDQDDPITIDLRNTFKEELNSKLPSWGYNIAKYGCWFVRAYGAPGQGINLLRSDYYTHPYHVFAYERLGQIVGFRGYYQKNKNQLMNPWDFIFFRMPNWSNNVREVPMAAGEIALESGDYASEPVSDCLNYGQGILDTAYGPYVDLLEAIISLNLSRKNASRLERLIGLNTGRLSPTNAAKYLNTVSAQIARNHETSARELFQRGRLKTIINHLIPIWGDGKGRLEISTVEGNPNIEGLEDVELHVKRLGSALGIDPALLGFGEMLSGGLGDGGFFRLSITAAIKANAIRHAISRGLETLFEIHVAYKFGKVFLPGEKPWRTVFNSVSSALEREEMENSEARVNFATLLVSMMMTLDQELQAVNKPALYNYLWTDIMRVDEEKFRNIFPEKLEAKEVTDDLPEGDDIEDDDMYESAARKVFAKFYNKEA